MAWRDSRASRSRLLLFSLSIVFGIGAVVALGSISDSLMNAVHTEAKGLLGADLVVSTHAPFSAGLQRTLAALGGKSARETVFNTMMAFPGSGGAARMVQVMALEPGFPFYGNFDSEPAGAVERLRGGGSGDVVILEESLLNQFGVKTGDTVKLGRKSFTVIGALKNLSGGDGPVAALFAPRVVIPLSSLEGTGLLGVNALVRYQMSVMLPAGLDAAAVANDLRDRFRGDRISVETARSRERLIGQQLTDTFDFLGMAGFVALLLGAIGVASAIHVYVRQKIATVALLRCLGASARQSFSIYLSQGVALGAIGAVVGTIGGVAAAMVVPALIQQWLPFSVDASVSWPAVARGASLGWGICVLFALLPLLAVRRVPPLAALRSASAGAGSTAVFDPWIAVVAAAIAAAVTRFAIVQAGSLRLGVGFTAMLCFALGSLTGLAWLVAWAARRWAPRRLPYVVRHGVANLHRPNNRTVLLLVSLGLGTFLVLTLFLARTTLRREIGENNQAGQANLMFFDIQDDQIDPLGRLLASRGAPILQRAPVVAMKIVSLNGRPAEDLLADPTSGYPRWALRREYRSTFRGQTAGKERIVSGQFVGRVPPGAAEIPISVEQGLARDLRLKLGDEIDWDVQGVPFKTRVASLRSVEWRQLEPNFFVVFPEGALEAAPKFYLATVRAATPADSARLQRDVVGAFPNVSAIDLFLLLETLDKLLSKIALVLDLMAFLTVATGLVVLAGAVVAGRDQRSRETMLLRTLGASRRQLGRIQLVEYAALGTIAALFGCGLAVVANALLARRVFHAPADAPPLTLAAAVAIVAALTLITGRLSDRGFALRPPLEALRRQG